jgi:hypothetical protein
MKTLNLEFSQQDWQNARETWQAWWDGTLERPLVVCEGYRQFGWHQTRPDAGSKPNWTFAGFYPLDMPVEDVLDRYQDILEAAYFLGDGLPKFYVNIGPGVLAALLGADFEFVEGSTWFSPPMVNGVSWEHTPLEQIDLTLNLDHPLWQRICALTEAGIERWGATDLRHDRHWRKSGYPRLPDWRAAARARIARPSRRSRTPVRPDSTRLAGMLQNPAQHH